MSCRHYLVECSWIVRYRKQKRSEVRGCLLWTTGAKPFPPQIIVILCSFVDWSVFLQVWQFTRLSQSLCLSLWLSQPWSQHSSLKTGRKVSFTFTHNSIDCRTAPSEIAVDGQRYKVWFYVCFLSLVRVSVAVRSREMAATIAISARSTSRKKAAKTWQTSPQPGCPARWTYSLPTMTACSVHMSAFGLPCPSTQMRWSSRHLSTRPLTTETGTAAQDCL